MADQGNVDTYDLTSMFYYDPHSYAGYDVIYGPASTSGVISGTTSINGVATGGIEVSLFWRPTMTLVGKTISDSAGWYTFTGIIAGTTNYVVYFKDPPGGTAFNDVVYALIDTTP